MYYFHITLYSIGLCLYHCHLICSHLSEIMIVVVASTKIIIIGTDDIDNIDNNLIRNTCDILFCYLRLRLIKRKISEKKKKEGREDRHSERHRKRETDWPGKEIMIKSKKKKMYVILCYVLLTFIITVVSSFILFS